MVRVVDLFRRAALHVGRGALRQARVLALRRDLHLTAAAAAAVARRRGPRRAGGAAAAERALHPAAQPRLPQPVLAHGRRHSCGVDLTRRHVRASLDAGFGVDEAAAGGAALGAQVVRISGAAHVVPRTLLRLRLNDSFALACN